MNTMKIKIYGEDDDGDFEEEVEVPSKWEICQECRGNGTHVNRNIDGNGLTAEQWEDWDDEEREGYFSGRYDVQCKECAGTGKIQVVDYESCSPEIKAKVDTYDEQQAESARHEAEDRHTRWQEGGWSY